MTIKLQARSKQNSSILNQAGMTLIEIMAVLAIVGTLMAILGQTVAGQIQKAKLDNAKIQIREIGKQLDMYNKDCGSYPTTEQGLAALTKSPGAEACGNWGPTPYLKRIDKDPWSTEFVYVSDGGDYELKSFGRDKKECGTDAYTKDISSKDL